MERFRRSIEIEPKTLKEGELSYLREAAVGITQNKDAKKASSVFKQGKRAMKETYQMKEELKQIDQKIEKDTEVFNQLWKSS